MKKILQNNKKLIAVGFLMMVGGLTTLYAAGDFSNVDGVVTNFESSVNTTVGKGMKLFMGWLPLVLFGLGLALGIKQSKKKSENDQEGGATKVALIGAIGGIAGAFVGVLVDALLGAGLMQDSAKGLLVLKNYWQGVLGLAG
jgi:hypothetical protein